MQENLFFRCYEDIKAKNFYQKSNKKTRQTFVLVILNVTLTMQNTFEKVISNFSHIHVNGNKLKNTISVQLKQPNCLTLGLSEVAL